MGPLTEFEATVVAEYLRREAPRELERLESIDQLLISCSGGPGWVLRTTNSSTGGTVMPRQSWANKRERQYEHIRDGLEERGRPASVSEEIAARTVNKERARSGEAKTASRSSTDDLSSGRRGGLRSHSGPGGRTKRQLYEEARRMGIDGRSTMDKSELERAVDGY